MSTRSLTVFKSDEKEIVVLYRHCDGYLEGHGKELAEFCKNLKIVNGFGYDTKGIANGIECLAAQVVANFKTECGNFYLYPAGTRGLGEEYIYTVSGKENEEPHISVKAYGETIFDGYASDLCKRIEDGNLEQDL